MQLEFFDIDSFAESLKEVTTSRIYSKNGFDPEGPFSLQIFGPTLNATCGCPIYWGRSMIGQTCQTCGVDITFSSERRKRFAKIVLPFPVLSPIMYQLIVRAGKTKFKGIVDNMISNDQILGFLYDPETREYEAVSRKYRERESDDTDDDIEIPEGKVFFESVINIKELIETECANNKDLDPIWNFIHMHIDKFYINNFLIPPPDFRPVSKNKDAQMRDELNGPINELINLSNTLKQNPLSRDDGNEIYKAEYRKLHRKVYDIFNFIVNKKLSKKRGLIRGSILGKRVDFSARAVIVPDPELTLDECSLPYLMALELFKIEVANILLERRMFKRYDSAITYIEEIIKSCSYELLDIVREAVNGEYVILNRQPTLHRMGLMAFKAKVNSTDVIKIHPLACAPYNADFDGDQMAVYRPLSEAAINECEEKLLVSKNLISPTTGDLILGVNQDIVLGIYLLTKGDESENKIQVDGVGETYQGRVLFNDCLPDEYPFYNQPITKKVLNVILNDIARTHSVKDVVEILDNLKELGFKYTTIHGATMSLDGMDVDGLHNIAREIFDKDIEWHEKLEMLQSEAIKDRVKEAFPPSMFVESGSRGSWDQANQIILARGWISNFKGDIIKEPIENSLITGLTRQEFFNSCYGSRKGLLDTALNTGVSGYLTRKLVYCGVNLEVDNSCEDCGTNDCVEFEIPNERNPILARCLIGRYYKDDDGNYHEIDYLNYHTFAGSKLKVRSPIYCKNPKICKKCYGKFSDDSILHGPYIGVVAAQAMGEVSTQLVLRTFHNSGVAKLGDDDQQADISNDLVKVNRIFHNSGNHLTGYMEAIMSLFDIYSEYSKILLVHYECIVSQMMRCGNRLWRLVDNREQREYELASIESIPSRESWLLALAFSKPKSYLIDGIIDDSTSSGILESIMMNNL